MTEKWADYGISAVRYNSSETHIEKVRVHKDSGDSIETPEIWLREKVVSSLETGYTFVTILKNNQGNWNKGRNVEIVRVNGTKYIRTDRNSIASDNLENLPRF